MQCRYLYLSLLKLHFEAYALKLHNAGFYLKQLHYPSLFHGFISISLLRTARRAMEDMIDTLKKEL